MYILDERGFLFLLRSKIYISFSDEWQTKSSLAKDPENNHSFIKFFCCCKFPEKYCQAKQHGFMFNAWL